MKLEQKLTSPEFRGYGLRFLYVFLILSHFPLPGRSVFWMVAQIS